MSKNRRSDPVGDILVVGDMDLFPLRALVLMSLKGQAARTTLFALRGGSPRGSPMLRQTHTSRLALTHNVWGRLAVDAQSREVCYLLSRSQTLALNVPLHLKLVAVPSPFRDHSGIILELAKRPETGWLKSAMGEEHGGFDPHKYAETDLLSGQQVSKWVVPL